jgi:anti-sigma B factor antagonist
MVGAGDGNPTGMPATGPSAGNGTTPVDTREFAVAVVGVGDHAVVLHVAGELDVSTAPRLREHLNRALEDGAEGIVVDLTHVTFIDSIALAVLVAARARLAPAGRLAVVARTPFVRLVLEATGLDDVLDVFADRAAARAFATPRAPARSGARDET